MDDSKDKTTAAALKDRFKAGSIPLQTDFADLIDMAEMGRRAVGGAPDQSAPGTGFTLDDKGTLQLKLNENYDGKDYSPVKYHDDILTVDLGSGLINASNGICVGAGNGIKVNTDYVSIDPQTVLPKGIITMFSGSQVPDGWLLCDGTNGTPNLVDRFILGGHVEDINTKNSVTLSGDKTDKKVSVQTNTVTPSIKVTVGGHSLTIDEMPSHSHIVSGTSRTGGTSIAFDCHVDGGYSGSATTTSTGGGASHAHSASASQDTHQHHVEIAVPYYVLAFIMKS